ncbi:MAG: hypothetical protein VYA69_09210 [Gemmatimonadota bacterium]|nr:hypothetical protein [Gemmatimonadota bacterium]
MSSMPSATVDSTKLLSVDDPRIRILFAGVLVVIGGITAYFATSEEYLFSTRVALILGYVVGIPLLLSANYERSIMLTFAFASVAGMLKYKTDFNPIIHVTVDIMLLLICAGWLIRHMFNPSPISKTPMSKLIGVFVFICLIQVFNPLGYSYFASVAALKMHIFTIPLFFFAYHYFRSTEQFKRWALWFGAIGLMMSYYSIDQYQKGPEQMKLEMPEYSAMIDFNTWQDAEGVSYFRPMSTTSNPGGASTWMQCFIPIVLAVFMFKNIENPKRYLLAVILVILIGTLLISLIRQMTLVTIASVMLVLAAQLCSGGISRRVGSLVGVIFVVIAGWQIAKGLSGENVIQGNSLDLLVDPVKSYMDNRGQHLTYIHLTLEGYPLGAGLGRTGPAASKFREEMYEYREKHGGPLGMPSENYFLVMIAETGIPGTIVITLITLIFLLRGLKIYLSTRDEDLKWVAIACWAVVFSIFFVFFGGPALVTPPLNLFFWFLAGVLLKIPELDDKNEGTPNRPVVGAVLSQVPR